MKRPLLALVLADAAAITGTRLSMIALPWLVLTQLGDPMLAGIVVFAEMAPYVVAKAAGGPLIDRLGARRISVAADLASIAAVALIPLLAAVGALGAATLIPVVALVGALRGPADAAKYAMVPAVADAAGVPYSRVTGIVATVDRLAGTVGAGLAAGLVALVGPANALGLNAAFFALAGLSVLVGMRGLAGPQPSQDAADASYLHRLGEGWHALRGDAVLVALTAMIAVTNLLDQAFAVVMVPVWAERSGAGVEAVGLLLMTTAGAAAFGAALAVAWAERLPRLATYAGCFLLVGLPRFAIFVADLPVAALLAVLAMAGFASGFINPVVGAVVLERIPARLTGRVTSLFTAVAWTLMPFGGLLAGGLIAALSLDAAFLVLGLGYFAATMLPLCLPAFRAMGSRPAGAPA